MAFTSAKSDGSSRHSEIEHRYEFVPEPAPHRRYMDESDLSFKVHNSLFRQLFARLFVYVYALYMIPFCRSNEATHAWICSKSWTSKTCMQGGKYRTNTKSNRRQYLLERYFDTLSARFIRLTAFSRMPCIFFLVEKFLTLLRYLITKTVYNSKFYLSE